MRAWPCGTDGPNPVTISSMGLVATLVMAFITTGGIVIAADTAAAVKGESPGFVEIQKVCRIGPASYVAIAGSMGRSTFSGTSAEGIDRVREQCQALATIQGLSVAERAERVADALVKFANETSVPVTIHPDGSVAAVLAAGFDGATPRIVGYSVRASPSSPPGPPFFKAGPLDLPDCYVMAGDTDAANALRSVPPSPIFPRSLVESPYVKSAVDGRTAPCTLPMTAAKRFFELAVQASFDYAADFKMTPGQINWPIDVVVIRPDGTIEVEHHDQQPP